jgi:hypothetical protein
MAWAFSCRVPNDLVYSSCLRELYTHSGSRSQKPPGKATSTQPSWVNPPWWRITITREKEILVQDKLNNLYLINNMGRVVWKYPLEAPILGEIAQIDLFKNNKLQYLFNTTHKIHLLDRNANPVANYPISLPATATNGLTVYDYDKEQGLPDFCSTCGQPCLSF